MSDSEQSNTRGDPLIDEVRNIRQAISEQFENDIDRLCEHLTQIENKYRERIAKPDSTVRSSS